SSWAMRPTRLVASARQASNPARRKTSSIRARPMERVIITSMGRAPLAGVLLVVSVGAAEAGNTRKVDIDSDPQGAQVFLEDIDHGMVCAATPCTIDAPVGTTPIILRKDGYNAEVNQIEVPRKGKVKTFKFTLASSIATLVFDDPALKGGTIRIDDVDKG